MPWYDDDRTYTSRRGHNPKVGKAASRRARGESMICVCGTQTFASHIDGHIRKAHKAKMAKRN